MSETKSDHLYVMQAATGRIKIGRSFNPKSRRKELQSASGQQIALLAVLEGQGYREREIHHQLATYRSIGEWFSCTPAAKTAICEALGLELCFHRRRNLDAIIEQERLTVRAETEARKAAVKTAISHERINEITKQICSGIREGGYDRRYPLRQRAWSLRNAYEAGRGTLERVNNAMALAGLPPIAPRK